MASLNPAKHAHMEAIVGSIAPGRYADVVLLSSVRDVAIKTVFANGVLAAQDGKYLLPVPKIDWPSWATDTIHVGRQLTAKDFEIRAPPRLLIWASRRSRSFSKPAISGPSSERPRGSLIRIGSTKRPLTRIS